MSDALIPVSSATGVSLSLLYTLDAEQLSVGINTVLRERMQVTGAGATEIARVTNSTPGQTDMGLVTRIAGFAVATASLAAATLAADGQPTNLRAALDGGLVMREEGLPADGIGNTITNTDGASTQVLPAAGAGLRNIVTDITMTNSSASPVTVLIQDGVGGATLWHFPVPPSGSGVVHRFKRSLRGSANTPVAIQASGAVSSVTVSLGGFTSKV